IGMLALDLVEGFGGLGVGFIEQFVHGSVVEILDRPLDIGVLFAGTGREREAAKTNRRSHEPFQISMKRQRQRTPGPYSMPKSLGLRVGTTGGRIRRGREGRFLPRPAGWAVAAAGR